MNYTIVGVIMAATLLAATTLAASTPIDLFAKDKTPPNEKGCTNYGPEDGPEEGFNGPKKCDGPWEQGTDDDPNEE